MLKLCNANANANLGNARTLRAFDAVTAIRNREMFMLSLKNQSEIFGCISNEGQG